MFAAPAHAGVDVRSIGARASGRSSRRLLKIGLDPFISSRIQRSSRSREFGRCWSARLRAPQSVFGRLRSRDLSGPDKCCDQALQYRRTRSLCRGASPSIQGATLDRVLEGLADNRIGMRTELRRVLEFDDKVRFGSGVSATAARRAQPISPHVLPADRASPEVSARTKPGRDLRPINRTGGESIGLRRGAVSGTNQGNSRVRFGRGCVKLAQQIGD